MNEVRFGLSREQRRFTLYLTGLTFAVTAFSVALGGPRYLALVVLISVLGYFLSGVFGATLDAGGVHLRGMTRQHIAWHRIAAVEIHGSFGAQTVKLRLVDGRIKLLRAPIDGLLMSDPEFGAKVETLRQWHREHTADAS